MSARLGASTQAPGQLAMAPGQGQRKARPAQTAVCGLDCSQRARGERGRGQTRVTEEAGRGEVLLGRWSNDEATRAGAGGAMREVSVQAVAACQAHSSTVRERARAGVAVTGRPA